MPRKSRARMAYLTVAFACTTFGATPPASIMA
jgi:hypothetical protein